MNKSLTNSVMALLCISGLCGLANPVAAQEATSQPNAKAICEEIAKSCPTTLLKGVGEPDGVIKLKGLVYDETIVKVLDEQLRVVRPDPIKLYIANLLVGPLLQAKPEVVKKALPIVEAAWKSMCGEYKTFPHYDAAALAQYQQPGENFKGTKEDLVKQQDRVYDAQKAKADVERLVVLHNQLTWQFEYVYFRMCMIAGDSAKDKTVMEYLLSKERQKAGRDIGTAKAPFNGQWLIASEAIKTEAKALSKDRAKYYYDEFRKIGLGREWEVQSYIKWAEPTTSRTDNSTYVAQPLHLGNYFLDAVNLLVPMAADPVKAPAMKVPTNQEIDDHNKPKPTPTPSPKPTPTPKPTPKK